MPGSNDKRPNPYGIDPGETRKQLKVAGRPAVKIAQATNGDAKTTGRRAPKANGKQYAKSLFGNRKSFYPKLHALAAAARNGDPAARTAVLEFDRRFGEERDFHEQIARWVRVPARKSPGEVKGSGKDEILRTSKTPYFLKWAANMLEGKEAVSTITGPAGKSFTFTVLDLQEKFRLPTSVVLTKAGGGHTGALRETKSSKGYMTAGQAELHDVRQAFIEAAATPLDVMHGSLRAHLEMTPNVDVIQKKFNKGFDVRNRDFSKPSDKAKLVEFHGRVRDGVKVMADMLHRDLPTTSLFRPLSPLRSTALGDWKYDRAAVPDVTRALRAIAGEK